MTTGRVHFRLGLLSSTKCSNSLHKLFHIQPTIANQNLPVLYSWHQWTAREISSFKGILWLCQAYMEISLFKDQLCHVKSLITREKSIILGFPRIMHCIYMLRGKDMKVVLQFYPSWFPPYFLNFYFNWNTQKNKEKIFRVLVHCCRCSLNQIYWPG